MDLRTLERLVPGFHWLGHNKAQLPCPLPGHPDGDPELSIVARQVDSQCVLACFGEFGHTAAQLLAAFEDLERHQHQSQDGSAIERKRHEEAFSSNGSSSNGSAAANGDRRHVLSPMDVWKFRIAEIVKVDCEKAHELTYQNTKPEQLIDSATNWTLSVIRETGLMPPEETDLELEIRNIASGVVQGYLDQYENLPAVSNGHLPAVAELDRTPVDAFEAYELMAADRRGYSWAGLVRIGCTMVLTALIGAGKTTLAANVVKGWAAEEEVLNKLCRKSKSLVVVSPKEFEAWAEMIHFWELHGQVYLIPSYKTHFDSGSEQARWFEATMKQFDCETFVLDTLFDFYGLPPNTHGDSNRIAMAEQVPLLEVVRSNSWSGLVTGHSPKSEAQAVVARDPEEAFAGHTAWTAQHRMRAVIRRKSQGVNAFVTGRGGHGDQGILKEQMLVYEEETRLVRLGGDFAEYLGETALPSILAALADGWQSRSDLMKTTGKGKNWVHAAIKYGLKQGAVQWNHKERRASKYALPGEPSEEEQKSLGI